MMKPPIPEPVPTPTEACSLSGRLEWDDLEGCFVLRYVTPIGAHARCVWAMGRSSLYLMLNMVLGLPLLLPLMLGLHVLRRVLRPNRLCLFEWGLRDITPIQTAQAHWGQLKRVLNRDGDVLVFSRSWLYPGFYFPRECFAEVEESRRLEEMLRALSQGQSWNEVRARFEARQGPTST